MPANVKAAFKFKEYRNISMGIFVSKRGGNNSIPIVTNWAWLSMTTDTG